MTLNRKTRTVILLVFAQVLAMSLWFASAAVIDELKQINQLSVFQAAAMSAAVQFGFVIGALLSAITGISDRYDPRRVFALFAVIAALANLLLLATPGAGIATALRAITGMCLAGVYPVGMKIIVGWGKDDRGWLVGLLVGGLTVGSASPHLLSLLGGAQWQITVAGTSLLALASVALVLKTELGPLHAPALRFNASAVKVVWTDKRIRAAYLGYFGHMWELYAMWAWIGVAASASYALQMSAPEAGNLGKLTAFCVIAGGALLCPLAGFYADRFNRQSTGPGQATDKSGDALAADTAQSLQIKGKATVAVIAMVVSCVSGWLAALAFGGPAWVFFIVAIVWGLSIIPDSAQFSALVADFAPADLAGSILTLQTAIGFAITILTVQLTPWIASIAGWPLLFILLTFGPLAGILAMRPLLR